MRRLPLLALLLGLILVFAPGLRGDFVWDDIFLIRDNLGLRDTAGLWNFIFSNLWDIAGAPSHWIELGQRYFRPFVKLAYWLQYRFLGPAPFGFHVVSLLLHAACVLLAHTWLRRRLPARPADAAAALLATALFALHPSRPEAVSWISGSADLWLTFWVLLGLTAWDRARGGAALAAVCWAIAFLCKEVAALVPMALAIDILCLQPTPHRAAFRRLGAASVLVIGLLAVRLVSVSLASAGDSARGPAIVAASAGHYVARVVWPWRPSTQVGLVHPDGRHHPEAWAVILGGAAFAALLVTAVAAARRRRLRPWVADLGWFIVPLIPVLNFVPLGYSVLIAERFLYLPLLGVSALAGRTLVFALERRSMWRHSTLGLAALLLMGYAVTSIRHILHFRSELRLWQYEVGLHPSSSVLHLSLAWAQWNSGQYVAAMQSARASYTHALLPHDHADAAVAWASFHLQTATDGEQDLLTRIRDFLDALVTGKSGVAHLDTGEFVMAVELSPAIGDRFRDQWSFSNHRALAHARTLNLAEAERQLRELALVETGTSSLVNLARVLALQERWQEASRLVNQALVRQPQQPGLFDLRATLSDGLRLTPPQRGHDAIAADSMLASEQADSVVRGGIERARVTLELTSPESARLVLDGLLAAYPQDARLVVARVVLDVMDGQPDLAQQRLRQAQDADPERSHIWKAAQDKLKAAAPPPPPPPRRTLRLP